MKMQETIGNTLVTLVKEGKDIYIVDPEMISSTGMTVFEQIYPERTITVGIAEQNAVGIAAGLACYGKTAIVSSFSCFLSTRSLDQIRVGCAYGKLNVKLIGCHGGLATGPDGATHEALEDIAILRAIPNMTLIVPADSEETAAAMRAAIEYNGPVYIRLARPDLPSIGIRKFELGCASVLRNGTDASVIACGTMVHEALTAAASLTKEKIAVRVIDMASIKPLDTQAVLDAASQTGAIVTAEDHNIIGGLGGAVAETLADNGTYLPFERVGIHDKFGKSGNSSELYRLFGICADDIAAALRRVIAKKRQRNCT